MSEWDDWLPPLLTIDEFNDDWLVYFEAVYSEFTKDFILTRPIFRGQPVKHKRHPMEKGKEATFWHIISEGAVESERTPNINRWKRIRWPKPIIEQCDSKGLRVWRERKNGEMRTHIALGDYSYLVVLAERNGYILFWTAYYVEWNNGRRKLEKRFKSSIKS